MLDQNVKLRSEILSKKHENTETDIGNLARVYWHLHQFRKIEELRAQVLEARKMVLAAKHPGTLLSMGNLAVIYHVFN